MSQQDFENWLSGISKDRDQADALTQSLARGADQNPDEYAKALSLAAQTGVAPTWAKEFRPALEKRRKLDPISIDEIVRSNPKTAQFLAVPDNAAVSHDDIGNLQKHESLFDSMASFSKNAVRSLGAAPGGALAGFAGVTRAAAEFGGMLLEPLLQIERGLTGLEVRNPLYDLGEHFGQSQRIYEAGAKKTKGDLSKSSPTAQAVYSGIESAGQTMLTLPLAIATGNPWATLLPMGFQTGGQAYGQAREQGVSPAQALPFAVAQGVVEVATEKLPAFKLIEGLGLNHGIRGAARLLGGQLVTENWTEQVATALQDLNEWAVLPENKTKSINDYLAERPNAALQTFIATTTGTLLQTGAAKAVDTTVNRAERQQQRLFFEALGQSATESKLRQRLPDKYREFVEQATKDGPVQDVLIPADQFKTYFQTQEMDPATVARELNARNYQEAQLSGADVRIPLADFAEKIAATPHLQGLQDDLRLRHGQLTEREARDAQEQAPEANAAVIERMRQIVEEQGATKPLDTAVELVTANVQAQLEGAGMKAETAKDQATVMRGVAILANRAYPEMDPLQAAMRMWERYGITIQGPNLGGPQGRTVDLEAAKQRAARERLTPKGRQSLDDSEVAVSTFVKRYGGLKIPDNLKEEFGKWAMSLADKNGLAPDEMAELAYEAGLIEDKTTNALLDGLKRGQKSARVAGDTTQQEMEFMAAKRIDELTAAPTEVHYQGKPYQSVKREGKGLRLEGGPLLTKAEDILQVERGVPFDVPASEHVKKFFQAFFHGSPHTFEQFDLSKIGTGEGAQSYGWGLYFAENPQTAESYRSTLAGDELIYKVDGKEEKIDTADPRGMAIKALAHPDLYNPESLAARYRSSGATDEVWLKNFESALADLDGHVTVEERKGGAIYTVEIPDEVVAKMLDWDKSFHQQTPEVQAALGNVSGFKVKPATLKEPVQLVTPEGKAIVGRGEQIYHELATTVGDAPDLFIVEESTYSNGKPAWLVRSRHVKFGVLFDTKAEADAEAAKENKKHKYNHEAASKYLASLGIPGIKYADQLSRGKQQQTRNVVLFDPSLITEVKRNGETVSKAEAKKFFQSVKQSDSESPMSPKGGPGKEPTETQAPKPEGGIDLEWFGDSKIVTEDGDPLLVYHGTNRQFDEFDLQYLGSKSNSSGLVTPSAHLGFWFSPEDVAKPYADPDKPGARVIAAYLKLENPKYYSKAELAQRVRRYDDAIALREGLERQGYDGIIAEGPTAQKAEAIVAFYPEQIKIRPNPSSPPSEGGQQFFAGEPGDKRASIEFGPDRQVTISLLENRNLSSFLHEAGHFYFEVLADLAADAETAQQVKDDYATILKFVGKDSREAVTTEDHEKIARAFEQYLREGRAPSAGLRSVFQRFKAWLTFIYKSAKDLRVALTDDVREVFDRVLATDEQIFLAKQEMGAEPMITTPDLVGWTKEQFDLYTKAVAEEVAEAKDALQNKLMGEYAREQKKAYREELAKVRGEVEDQARLMPVYLAYDRLTKGEMMGGDPAKLNRKALVDRYGEQVLKSLPKSVYAEDGNIDADTGATFFGFASGDDLIKALAEMVPQGRYVAARTKQIMAERHGDTLVDGTIAKRAMDALHNEKRLDVIRMELRALRGKLAEVSPLLKPLKEEIKQGEKERAYDNRFRDAEEAARYQQARQATETAPPAYYRNLARQTIEASSARQIQPNNYIVAARTASRLAFEAMSKGDYVEAAIQKQRELMSHYLYIEAAKARDEIDAIVKFAKRFDTTAVREAMGKAQIGGGNYLEQIDAILNRYEFRKVPIVQLERRESLMQWVQAQQAAGYDPVIDDTLLNEARKINYQSVPLTELRAIKDALQNIEHLARLKNRLAFAHKQIDFATAKGELTAAASQNIGLIQQAYSESARPLTERAKQVLAGLDAGIIRTETLINWLDGDNVKGPWHEYIWNPLKAAQHELNDEAKATTEKIEKLYKAMSKEWRKGLLDHVRIDGIAETLTRKDLIGYALNLGNAQNREKLTAGNFAGDAAVVEKIQQRLTAEDWHFVQQTWDIIDSMWPKINAVQKRLNGVDMKKVEAVPFTARDEQGNEVAKLQGGYYPLVADRKRSTVGLRQEGDLFEETYVRTSTSHGFTKDRTGAKYPLDRNFERILGSHLAQVMKDFTHREAVLAVNKILTDSDIRQTLTAALGEKYEPLFRSWLKDIANDTNRSIADGMDQWSRVFTAARANVVAAVMGFKATTMLSQFVSLSGSLDRVGPKYLGKALMDYVRHPIDTTQAVFDQSGEMRHRANNLDRDIRARLRMLVGKQTVMSDVQRVAFHGIAVADSMVAVITWRGAFDQALAAGKDVETSKLEADAAVRITQGAGEVMDQAAVQRNRGEFWRAVTMFYSFYNAQYSQGRDIGFQVDGAKDLPRALTRAFLIFVIPAITADLVLGRGPGGDDDEPGYLGWAIKKALLAPMATIPLLRDVGQALESGYDIRFTPIADVVAKMQRLGKRATKDVSDERDIDFGRYAAEVAEIAAYLFGVPGAAQIRASGSYLSRVAEGEEEPANALELLYRTAVGKRKEK